MREQRAAEEVDISRQEMLHMFTHYTDLHAKLQKIIDDDDDELQKICAQNASDENASDTVAVYNARHDDVDRENTDADEDFVTQINAFGNNAAGNSDIGDDDVDDVDDAVSSHTNDACDDDSKPLSTGQHSVLLKKFLDVENICIQLSKLFTQYVELNPFETYFTVAKAQPIPDVDMPDIANDSISNPLYNDNDGDNDNDNDSDIDS